MDKHTPGPWALESTDTEGESIYVYPANGSQNDDAIARLINTPQGMANAKLIAAAPDMYAALSDAYAHIALLASGQKPTDSNAEMCERLGAAMNKTTSC